jgi:hypothetical protein
MTCRSQTEWDTAADLPDDLPDAICHECGEKYTRKMALTLNGWCEFCSGLLVPDNGDAQ